jgi:PhnB protein
MVERLKSEYGVGLQAVRPYLTVSSADVRRLVPPRLPGDEPSATTPSGHRSREARIGDSIIEIGEHPDASGRSAERLPRVGLRLYVADVDETYARALAAGATGDAPSNRLQGSRAASAYDPFGLTWWLAATIE